MAGTCDTAHVRERCSTIVRYVDMQIFDPVVFMIHGFRHRATTAVNARSPGEDMTFDLPAP